MLDTKIQEALEDVSFKIDIRDIQGILLIWVEK